MKSIDSLKELYVTAKNIPDMKFLSQESEKKNEDNIERVENLFVVPILNFLFEGNYKKLIELENRFNQNTPIYNLAKFAGCLCADETDFDFLTNPDNLENYVRLKKIAGKFNKETPCYVDILQKICDNKSLGLYQEFQEIYFFFEEVEKSSRENFAVTFENYKRILKLQTQKIFKEFISIDLFERALEILLKYENKISDENVLDFYIFGELFFNLELSNENENILIKHIDFCVRYLSKIGVIDFKDVENKKYFSQYANLGERLKLFFENESFDDTEKFEPLLKDYSLNNSGVVEFLGSLKEILEGKTVEIKKSYATNFLESAIFALDIENEMILFWQRIFLIAETESVNLTKIEALEELFNDKIIGKIHSVFNKNKNRIIDEKTLCFYVYGALYYNRHLSNKNENLLLHSICICVHYLVKRDLIMFEKKSPPKYISNINDLETRFKMLFQKERLGGRTRTIALLKDYSLNDSEIVNFCYELKKVFDGESVTITFSSAVHKFDEIINFYHQYKSEEMISFLLTLFQIARTKDVSLNEINFQTYFSTLLPIVEMHFLTIRPEDKIDVDLRNLENLVAFGEYYDALNFLIRKDIFSRILVAYNRHEYSSEQAVEFLKKSIFQEKDAKQFSKNIIFEAIEFLYTIIIENLHLKFDVGDVIQNDGAVGTVIQILYNELPNHKKMFLYRIRWSSGTIYNISVEQAKNAKLKQKKFLR